MKFLILPELELTDLNAQKITGSCGWCLQNFVNLDGIGFATACSVLGCWRWSIITIVKVDLRQRRFIYNSRRNTSLAVIVHNNKPQEDG
jgi:hypothetical protein